MIIFQLQPVFKYYESGLKTAGFGLKPGKCLVSNSPTLKGGAIDVRDIQGFSHIIIICSAFLD